MLVGISAVSCGEPVGISAVSFWSSGDATASDGPVSSGTSSSGVT